jgi:hypothetical protein
MPEVLTVKLRNGDEVIAKMYEGEPCAKTYANRTQANNKVKELGAGWAVVQRGRPFYVAKREGTPTDNVSTTDHA